MSEGKVYLGVIKRVMEWEVLVDPGDGSKPARLNPRLDVANHSPTGFAWGYWGSGPAQTALAILCDAVGVERAKPLYQRFKQDKIGHLSQRAGWSMDLREILVWVEQTEAADRDADAADAEDECDHEWVHTGTAYGGDDESYHGEGRVYCSKCGADGDG